MIGKFMFCLFMKKLLTRQTNFFLKIFKRGILLNLIKSYELKRIEKMVLSNNFEFINLFD